MKAEEEGFLCVFEKEEEKGLCCYVWVRKRGSGGMFQWLSKIFAYVINNI